MSENVCNNGSGSSFVNLSLAIICSVLGSVMTPLGIFLAINQSNTLWLVNMSLPGFFSLLVGLFLCCHLAHDNWKRQRWRDYLYKRKAYASSSYEPPHFDTLLDEEEV